MLEFGSNGPEVHHILIYHLRSFSKVTPVAREPGYLELTISRIPQGELAAGHYPRV
jgi:hypothetical protein